MKKISPKQFDLITTLLKHLGLEDVVPETSKDAQYMISKLNRIKKDRLQKLNEEVQSKTFQTTGKLRLFGFRKDRLQGKYPKREIVK